MNSSPSYALDNASPTADSHHGGLAALWDPFSRTRINALGLSSQARCLEIGAGGGSISRWLAGEVATAGQVVALDLKPQLIAPHPRLAVVAHDLTSDAPLPPVVADGGFGLVYGRFVMGHLPVRDALLPRLVDLLAPGGWLLLEDFGPTPGDVAAIAAPSDADRALFSTYQHAMWNVFQAAGTDYSWPCRTWPAMSAAGLVQVEAVMHARLWQGGSAGAQLSAATAAQMQPQLRDTLTADEWERVSELLGDPRLVVHTLPVYSTSGRRPDPSRRPTAAAGHAASGRVPGLSVSTSEGAGRPGTSRTR